MALVPAGKTALLLQKTEERVGIVAVDLDRLETGEVGAVGEFAEIVDRLIGAGGLLAKLVAGEIEDFKALGVLFLIEGFEFLILRSKATLGSGVYYEEHFVGILAQRYLLAFSVFDSKIENGFHLVYYKYQLYGDKVTYFSRDGEGVKQRFLDYLGFSPQSVGISPPKNIHFPLALSGYNANFAA